MNEPAPGWAAIDAAMRKLYGDREPKHWGTLIPWAMGGPDPLDAISCWGAEGHWHFVGYGSSELYEKTSPIAEQSGLGFELTFRLTRRPGETAPPEWAVALLQKVARDVVRSGRAVRPGEHVEHGGPLGGDEATAIRALAFVEDPELGIVDTPNGRLRFVQVVGITLDEREAMKDWSAEGVLRLLGRANPRLVTDLSRPSLRDDPAMEAEIQAGAARDGSSQSAAHVEQLEWNAKPDGSLRLVVDAVAIPDLLRLLRGRIPFGRAFRLQGPSGTVVFWPGGFRERTTEPEDDVILVELTADQAEAMHDGLAQRPGLYAWPEIDGLTVEVLPGE